MTREHRFSTERLNVDEWHSFSSSDWPAQDLPTVVQETLTEPVTAFLPPPWQGTYTVARAGQWITERDAEGITLLVVDKASQQAIGLVILFESDAAGHLRLGYMLRESAWGKGFASELIGGFVLWCRQQGIKSVTGGVERDNRASSRILEKNGFVADASEPDSEEQLFRLNL